MNLWYTSINYLGKECRQPLALAQVTLLEHHCSYTEENQLVLPRLLIL